MAVTSFGEVPLPLNNRMAGNPLDVERIAQAVKQEKRRLREAAARIRRQSSTNGSWLRSDRVAFIKIGQIDGLSLNNSVVNASGLIRNHIDAPPYKFSFNGADQ